MSLFKAGGRVWLSPAMPMGIAMMASKTTPGLESHTTESQPASKQNGLSILSGSEDNLENVKRV